MKELRIDIKKIIAPIVVIALLCAWLLLLWRGHAEHMGKVLLNYGFISLPIVLLWIWLNYKGWHCSLMQNDYVRNSLGLAPDLRGRWEGTIDRYGENRPHRFVVEIKQTMTCIQIYSYSSRGRSDGITHSFICDELGGNETICYSWRGRHGRLASEVPAENIFYGFSRCRHRKDTDGRRFLEGDYFTNRQPEQSMGKILLEFKGLELEHHF